MEAVEDSVGGNNHALAQKIAAKHPGIQLYILIQGLGGKSFLSSVCMFIYTMRMLVTANPTIAEYCMI